MALAELAAEVCGDAHGLDAGRPLGSLCIRLAARLGGWEDWRGSRQRQQVWTSVGVLVDELSSSALVLNLRASGESLTARMLDLCAESGEPVRLSLRQLLKDEPCFCHQTVHICENPTILGAAAERLGPGCAPLVCVEGKPSTAAQVLLDRLAAGRLLYHGDFDWPGLAIANTVMERHGALPWRFGSSDYLALDRGLPLEGTPVEPSWDPELAGHMQARGLAVHEEQVSETLLSDLG